MSERYDGKEVPPSITTNGASLPKWVEGGYWVDPRHCEQVEKALAVAIEALNHNAKYAVHTYWEDRGSDLLEHSLECAACKAKDALAEIERMGEK